jgi:hypothetical protein
MTYILLFLTTLASAIIDSIWASDSFAKYGLWFSRDGYKCKYILTEWLNKYLPLWLSKFLAQDVLVIFTDLFHFAKFVMILSFLFCIFGFTWWAIVVYIWWGLMFNFIYYLIR